METLLRADPPIPREAWQRLKGWYKATVDRAPPPARATLERITAERVDLYSYVPSPGENIPVTVRPVPVDDLVPTKEDIQEAVHNLHRNRSRGPSGMRAEHLKGWLAASKREKRDAAEKGEGKTDGEEGGPAEPHWENLMELIQTAFWEGELAKEATWQAVVLIPKGKQDYQGNGLVDVIWKVVAAILNCRLTASITYHNFLNGFRAGRGTCTANLEAKPLQQLAALREEVLCSIFLDLHKAYDDLDSSRCLEILEGYGVGPRSRRLLRAYWGKMPMVTRAGGYYGEGFKGAQGVTQGDPLSPTIFNVVVDAVVRHWVTMALDKAEKRGEGGDEGRYQVALFYADDDMVALSDPHWLQWAFNALVSLFERVGLRKNVGNTVSMVCQPCLAAGTKLEAAYGRKMTGEGLTYRER